MTQKERILIELNKGGWFSLGDSLNLNPPIYALSQRIGDLKKDGNRIEVENVPGKTYARYRLQEMCPCGFPQSSPIQHEHNRTERIELQTKLL